MQVYNCSWIWQRTDRWAIEDVLHAITECDFATEVIGSIDSIEDDITEATSEPEAELSDTDKLKADHQTFDHQINTDENHIDLPGIVDKIDVYRPDGDQFYSGTVSSFSQYGLYTIGIDYDDSDHEMLETNDETWRYTDTEAIIVGSTNMKRILSVEPKDLELLYNHFERNL